MSRMPDGHTFIYKGCGADEEGRLYCLNHKDQLLRLKSTTASNPGRWFYKCEQRDVFIWEDELPAQVIERHKITLDLSQADLFRTGLNTPPATPAKRGRTEDDVSAASPAKRNKTTSQPDTPDARERRNRLINELYSSSQRQLSPSSQTVTSRRAEKQPAQELSEEDEVEVEVGKEDECDGYIEDDTYGTDFVARASTQAEFSTAGSSSSQSKGKGREQSTLQSDPENPFEDRPATLAVSKPAFTVAMANPVEICRALSMVPVYVDKLEKENEELKKEVKALRKLRAENSTLRAEVRQVQASNQKLKAKLKTLRSSK